MGADPGPAVGSDGAPDVGGAVAAVPQRRRRRRPGPRLAAAVGGAVVALGAFGAACSPGRSPGGASTEGAPSRHRRPPPVVVARCSLTADAADALSVAEGAALWPWCRGALPSTLSTDGWQAEDRWARVETPAAGAQVTGAGLVDPRSAPVVVSVEVVVPPEGRPHQVLVTLFPLAVAGTWGVDGVAVTS